MKNKILCGVVVVLSLILVGVVSFKKETNFSYDEKKEPEVKDEIISPEKEIHQIKVYNQEKDEITTMNMEDYIIGVVAAEMPVSFEIEALKAQAVAARTFALYKKEHSNKEYDVVKGVSDQAFNTIDEMKKKWADKFDENFAKIQKAVIETENEILTYQNQVIESFYFSMSNGYTEKCELVFQQDLPYIESVESAWDNKSLNNYEVITTFEKKDFCSKLEINCDEIKINSMERTDSKRIRKIVINDKEFTGVQLRTLLKLRSTDFDIDIEDKISITTRGSGHGVGMSQYGANGMAKEGYPYQEILEHYYQNIEISKI